MSIDIPGCRGNLHIGCLGFAAVAYYLKLDKLALDLLLFTSKLCREPGDGWIWETGHRGRQGLFLTFLIASWGRMDMGDRSSRKTEAIFDIFECLLTVLSAYIAVASMTSSARHDFAPQVPV